MFWKPIVVGVDATPEAAWAAGRGSDLAELAGTTCHLVHAVHNAASAFALTQVPQHAEDLLAQEMARAREQVQHGLWNVVPAELAERLIVREGRAALVLKDVVREVGAGLVIVGGKHHSLLGRWLAGSTGLDVARTSDVPLLVMGGARAPMRRVLAAVDLSAAARPTIEAAERYAELLGAELRVMSVFEPLPIVPEVPNPNLPAFYAMLEEHIARNVWPLVRRRGAEKVTRFGHPVDVVVQEAADWGVDLLVVGSHGKGWVDRLLIGSVTERLLNRLPTSLLVVPVHAPVAAREPRPALVAMA